MLGARNTDYCVSSLGWQAGLTLILSQKWQDSLNYLLFCYGGLNNHDAIKRAAFSTMAAILKDDHFAALLADDGGDDDQDAVLKETHSMSKFAAQYA